MRNGVNPAIAGVDAAHGGRLGLADGRVATTATDGVSECRGEQEGEESDACHAKIVASGGQTGAAAILNGTGLQSVYREAALLFR